MLKYLTAHHIESYDRFLFIDIPKIIAANNTIKTAQHTIIFKEINYCIPKITPLEAKQKDLTYNISIEYKLEINTKIVVLEIFTIPLMLRSHLCITNDSYYNLSLETAQFKLCPNDPGGYFIVKGKERVLIPHIRPCYNLPMVKFEDGFYLCEFRSASEAGNSTLIQIKTDGKIFIEFSLPYIKQFIPAGAVFKTLNVEFKDVLSICGLGIYEDGNLTCLSGYHKALIDILFKQYSDSKTIADYVPADVKCKCKETYVKTILEKEIFNHLEDHSGKNVALHLGYMIERLIAVVSGEAQLTDKDDLAYKRVDTSGVLIEFLFRGLFKQYIRLIKNNLEILKNPDPINIIKSINVITNGLNLCFATGNWSVKKTGPPSYMRVGVSQVLCNHNYGSRLSHLRRLMHAVGFKGKNFKIRRLHASHYGFICPYETPEGERVGVVLNTALSVRFTLGIDKAEIKPLIQPYLDNSKKFKVILNGEIIGFTQDLDKFITALKLILPQETSIFKYYFTPYIKECHILSDQGRFTRKVFLKENVLDYVCAAAIHHTEYKDLPASLMFTDVMASVIPFYNHTQSPRIAYQSNMGKQAVGITTLTNGKDRYDPTFYILDYPQKALTYTTCYKKFKFDVMCHGAMPIVAVATMDGYNQEDSIILNKSSIDRGLFVITCYKTFAETEKYKSKHDSEMIAYPKFTIRNRDLDYSLLGKTGVLDPKLGKNNKKYTGKICNVLWIPAGTVLVGKISKKLISGVVVYKDVSLAIKVDEEGYLDELLDYYTVETGRIVKIKLRSPKIPEIGDKFASFTAQKGTCGMIYAQENMPFTKDGIVPDLIINPHAFPSRMTINYILQMCYNLAACLQGKTYDATAFKRYNTTEDLNSILQELNLTSWETEMYCGFTGKKFPSKIFIAPCDYQRLRHLVVNKIHSRISGPIDNLTHQPVAGRSRYGGIKVGEMEQWCKLSHGVSTVLKESLFDMSDKYQIPVCKLCKTISDDFEYCRKCDDIEIELKNCPYTSKLLFQELMAIGINIKFN
ncbi:DNA-directed RNA polymerase subunit 2 [Lymphocystis disease virus 1]|uniref:DNA-directed RNA polymerase subunit 2 n=1 Tax=Fish lymphocystis disease virus TaxID=36363 RepID=UPI0000161EA0|nr:DNA-directed RNA polymerase subunit 2 [Lymphocystis disease virus 1]